MKKYYHQSRKNQKYFKYNVFWIKVNTYYKIHKSDHTPFNMYIRSSTLACYTSLCNFVDK